MKSKTKVVEFAAIFFVAMFIISGCGGGGGGAVSTPNTAPKAVISVSPGNSVPAGQELSFDASSSTDAETPTTGLKVRWDFDNNGTWDTASSTTKIATHTYTTSGSYVARLAVSDTAGLTSFATAAITIFACGNNLACDDHNALSTDTCVNPGAANATCQYAWTACNAATASTDCSDGNSNTIDACVNPGAPVPTSSCTHTVNRTMNIRINAVDTVNAPVVGAKIHVVGPAGAADYTTDATGLVSIPNQGGGTYQINASQDSSSSPHFTAPSTTSFVLTADGDNTVTINVKPRHDVPIVLRNTVEHPYFSTATIGLFNAQNTQIATADVEMIGSDSVAIMHDVEVGEYLGRVTNGDQTNPIFVASDTPDLPVSVHGDIAVGDLVFTVLPTVCYNTDANHDGNADNCVINAKDESIMPTGKTVAECYNNSGIPGERNSHCRYR